MKKPEITLSINPSYFCNNRCSFCYLNKKQLSDQTRLPLPDLLTKINQVKKHYDIVHIDLYGGEPSLLPSAYFYGIETIGRYLGLKSINVVTNLIVKGEFLNNPYFDISVSYDMEYRPKHALTEKNMLSMERSFSVLMCLSSHYKNRSPMEILDRIMDFRKVHSLEIKPYSTNQANQQNISDLEYEEFIKNLIVYSELYDINLINKTQLQRILKGEGHSYSDDHLYITPTGEFAVLDFDIEGREYFKPIHSIEQYQAWTVLEKERVDKDPLCKNCSYKGKCLSEHLRPNKKNAESCSGYINLIHWGQEHYYAHSYA